MKREIRTYSADEKLVAARRKHIVKHALRLFSRKGYAGTNMDQVLRACGMSKGALYHYVGSKEDILSLAIEDASARQARMLDSLSAEVAYADSADALKQTVRAYLRLIDQQYDALRVLDQEAPTIPPYYRTKVFNNAIYVRQFMEGVIQKGVDSGQFKVENVSYAAYLVCVACLAWTGRRWLLGKRYSLADYVQEATASAMKIVRA